MKRSLMEVMMGTQGGGGGGDSILASVKFAVLPIAKVFAMCFMGFLMASKYVNILPANGRKLLNGVSKLFWWFYLTFMKYLSIYVGEN